VSRGFAGVNNHVLDDLRQLNRITNDWIQIRLKRKEGLKLRPAERKKDSRDENVRNIQCLFHRNAAFRESQQPPSQIGSTVDTSARIIEILRQALIKGRRRVRQIQIGNNDLKNIVEIVRNTGSERPNDFKPLGTEELNLHLLL